MTRHVEHVPAGRERNLLCVDILLSFFMAVPLFFSMQMTCAERRLGKYPYGMESGQSRAYACCR
jgi:hypothetical protein